MNEKETVLIVGIAGVAGLAYYLHMKQDAPAIVPKAGYQNPYDFDENTLVALGHGQDNGGGPAPASYPSNPFDDLYEKSNESTPQGRYSASLFQNANLTQRKLGLPFFTGSKGPNGSVIVYDPGEDNSYAWNPATNSVVSYAE